MGDSTGVGASSSSSLQISSASCENDIVFLRFRCPRSPSDEGDMCGDVRGGGEMDGWGRRMFLLGFSFRVGRFVVDVVAGCAEAVP